MLCGFHIDQIARSRTLRCGNSANFDRAVTFQLCANRFGQFLCSSSHRQPHWKSYSDGSPFDLVFHRPCTQTHCSGDRKSTRLNSSHSQISYAVFCLKKKHIYFLLTQLLEPDQRRLELLFPCGSSSVNGAHHLLDVPALEHQDQRMESVCGNVSRANY